MTLLLNFPKAGADLHVEELADVRRPGVDLLRDIIETVQAEPNITTAVLLERWRRDPQGRHLGKLAAAELPDDDEFDPAAELAQCLAQLAQAGVHDRIEFLIGKERLGSLTPDEKAELRELSQRPAKGGI